MLYFGSLDKQFDVDENLSSGILRFRLSVVCSCGRLDLSATVHTLYGRTHLNEVNAQKMATSMDAVLTRSEI